MTSEMIRKLSAEALGTMLLLAIVVGSGIMGDALSGGNDGIALLGNSIATGAGLVVLILIFGPVSGAHFNPAVTLLFLLRKELGAGVAAAYAIAQIVGAVGGVLLAHAMFGLDLIQSSATAREGFGQAISEVTATAGLLLTILGCSRFGLQATANGVGLFIAAGYWFTSSTSFANPAVAIARTLTDTFAGIRPGDAPLFIVAELCGVFAALLIAKLLFSGEPQRT
ncbi:MAG: aquaporin [Parvularculaceae bacterium]|nr:aquaporin family protein [Parvularculaceae bacterium]